MRHRIFTRAEIAAYVQRVYTSEYAPDEPVVIGTIRRLKNVTPPIWEVDYKRCYPDGHKFYYKAIVMAGRDLHGNAELCLPETIILPEEEA